MPEFLDHATNPSGGVCIFLETRAHRPSGWKRAGADALVIIHEDDSAIIANLSSGAVRAAEERGELLAVEVDRESRAIIRESWLRRSLA